MIKTWDRTTMRFASARYVKRQQMLDVTFENGDHFLVAVEALLAVPAPLDWAKMRIAETGDVLEVPASDSVMEIAWDRIRSIADPEFRAHLADRAVDRARRIGARIRALRLNAGLTPAELAEKVGVTREVVVNVEGGKIEPATDLIEHIALALGKRLRDFAEE